MRGRGILGLAALALLLFVALSGLVARCDANLRRTADAVVLPYLEATQSGVAQIALGFEKPVIATSVGGMAETIADGQTGLIVPPGDNAALSAAILRYFQEDLAEPLARNIHEIRESASWMPLVRLIEDLAAAIVARHVEQAVNAPSPRVL